MAKTLQDILKDLSNGITPSQADFLSALKDAGWNSNSGAFSGNNSKDIEELKRNLKEASAVLSNYTTVKGKLFGELQGDKARLETLKGELKDAEEEFSKAKIDLQRSLSSSSDAFFKNLLGANSEKTFEKALEKYDELKEKIEEFKRSLTEEELGEFYDAIANKDDNAIKNLETKKNYQDDLLELIKKEKELREEITPVLQAKTKELAKAANTEEQAARMRKQGWSDIKRGATEAFRIGKDFLDVWGKIDQAASKFAKTIGTGAVGMERLRKNAIESVQKGRFGAKYNVSADELIGLQETYSNTIGRNIQISASDQENMAAMFRVMGEGGGDFAAKLENFGLSYTDAANKAGKMFKEAGKYGISFDKYSKNVANNIKLAQNYTFKNGIKGLESMAKKATAMKLDMQQVASFADKVSTVEGAINTGAQLQVLGGPFAQFSDPMGMMNEALTDMEGLQDRFEKMIGGLGNFDAQKGEIAISAFDKQRIKVAAEAMGMSYDQVMETAMAKGRQKFIGGQIANKGYTEDEQELLKNIATVQNGKATVSYVDSSGKKQEVNLAEKSLSKTDLEMIKQQTQSESDDIKDIATTLRGWDDVMQGTKKQYENTKAAIIERRGWGVKAKNIVEHVGESNRLLGLILNAVIALGLGNAALSMLRGGGKLINGRSGGAGRRVLGDATRTKSGGGFKNVWESTARSVGSGVLKSARVVKNAGKSLTKAGYNTLGNIFTKGGQGIQKVGIGLAKNGGKILKVGGGIASGAISGVLTGIDEFGKGGKDYGKNAKGKSQNWKKYGRTAGSAVGGGFGAVLGGALGSMIAPGIGTAIGAALGGVAGDAIGKWVGGGFANQKRRAKKAEEFGIGGMLTGDYSVSELRKISKGKVVAGSKLEQKLKANNDLDTAKDIKQIREQQANIDKQVVSAKSVEITTNDNIATGKSSMANGGMLNGPSHAQGGMPILGSNIEVEGGEFVVNKRSAKKYQNTLNAINSMGDGGIIKPRKMETGGSVIINQTGGKLGGQSFGVDKITVDPINVNVSGSIKLEGANGQKAELTADLLKNPQFISEITKLITKQMNINIHGANVINRPDA